MVSDSPGREEEEREVDWRDQGAWRHGLSRIESLRRT